MRLYARRNRKSKVKHMNTQLNPTPDHDALLADIGAALAAPTRNVETLFGLSAQATQLATVSRRQADEVTARTLDPGTKAVDLPAALIQAEALKLVAARLERAVELSDAAIVEASDEARDAAQMAAYEHATLESGRVADRIRTEYPDLVVRLRDLLDDVMRTDELVARANRKLPPNMPLLHGPDGQARGFHDEGPNDGTPRYMTAVKLAQMVLPDPHRADWTVWPLVPDGRLQQDGRLVPIRWAVEAWQAHQERTKRQ